MKRPTMPLNAATLTPGNAEAPVHVGRGLSHRSANRMTKPTLAFIGFSLTILGAIVVAVMVVLVGRFDGLALLGSLAGLVGLAILFYDEELRWRQ